MLMIPMTISPAVRVAPSRRNQRHLVPGAAAEARERDCPENAADQASDVAADRDLTREPEREDEVDHDQGQIVPGRRWSLSPLS